MTDKIAIYVEPFPKNKRGDGFKNMASYRTQPHRGVDWSVAGGLKIKAITGGTVMEVGETKVLGHYLIQSTYDGHFILYAHFQVPTTLKQGDKVEAGQPLAVVEAMKMENILRAGKSGTVKLVNAQAGDSLAVDAVILEME